MQGNRLIGVSVQDLLIDVFSLLQTTGRVMLHSEVDDLLQGEGLLLGRHRFGVIQREEGVERPCS